MLASTAPPLQHRSDRAIPDNAPPTSQDIWAQLNQLVESRGGDPGLAIASVAIVSR